MILFEDRASTVLYNVLIKLENKNKFILPLNICPIVPETFIKANIKFEFIDINLNTLCMDEKLLLDKIKIDKDISGVLFVKTFGIELKTEQLFKKIKEINKDIFIIDDMCPSILQFDYDIEKSYADMVLFSSGYAKYIDIGYGGYAFLKQTFKDLFEDKMETKDFKEYKELIINILPKMKKHKMELNSIYMYGIDKRYHLGKNFNNWRFSIIVDNKDEILDEIFKIEGLFASSHYPQSEYASDFSNKQTNTKNIHSKIVNLFNDFRFDIEKAYQVVSIVNQNIKPSYKE